MALNKNVAKGIKTRQENELLENNKLIAEFMGIESFKDSLASLHQGKINVDVDVYEQAQYHTSWDWLMPVIKKAYNTEEVYDMGLEFHEIACQMFEDGIEEVYKTVVHTIKLINEDRAKEE